MKKVIKNLIIIPARGGSKGVSKKNIKKILGKPLIGYAIEAALQSNSFDKLVVSTDDHEIGGIARDFGAEVIMRPLELSGDTVLTEPVMRHVLDTLKDSSGYEPEFISLIQCTSPFLNSNVIKESVRRVVYDGFDSCLTVYTRHGHDFEWKEGGGGIFIPNHDIDDRRRRQDISKLYYENGAFYITKVDLFKKENNRFGGKVAKITTLEMREEDSLQIDNEFDFWLAERIMKERFDRNEVIHFKDVKILFLDFDGVLTDNKVLVNSIDDTEAVLCNRSDSLGIEMFKKNGLEVYVVSKEKSEVVARRCEKLNIDCLSGVDEKWNVVKKIIDSKDINPNEICYIGNDLNDLECVVNSGIGVATADAYKEVKFRANYVTKRNGGDGAVREIIDKILYSKK